ncbi:hypothetical protein BJ742DRAFT_850370 [Cladochytrium replicatum]|nr:hypothetical protein BJ742DRAFT_850370 [Cladochytrium replicatum]
MLSSAQETSDGPLRYCDACKNFIWGECFSCNECKGTGYDLCAYCVRTDSQEHKELNHTFTKHGKPEPAVLSPEAAVFKAIVLKNMDDLRRAVAQARQANPQFDINKLVPRGKQIHRYLVHYFKDDSETYILRVLVNECHLNILQPVNGGYTLVHLACIEDDGTLLEILITERWATPQHLSAPIQGRNPLMWAATQNSHDAIKVLVEKGRQDPNIMYTFDLNSDEEGEKQEITMSAFGMSLFWADKGKTEMAEVLLGLGCSLPRPPPETGTFIVSSQGVYVMDPYHRDLPTGAGGNSIMARMDLGVKFVNAYAGTWSYSKEIIKHPKYGPRVRTLSAWHNSVTPLKPDVEKQKTPFSVSVDGGRVTIASVREYQAFRAQPDEIARRAKIPHSKVRAMMYSGDPDEDITKGRYGVVSTSGMGDGVGYPVYAGLEGQLTTDGEGGVDSIRVVFLTEMGTKPEKGEGGACSIM